MFYAYDENDNLFLGWHNETCDLKEESAQGDPHITLFWLTPSLSSQASHEDARDLIKVMLDAGLIDLYNDEPVATLSDTAVAADVQAGLDDLKEGRVESWENMKTEFGRP